jgi:hypothetical protein
VQEAWQLTWLALQISFDAVSSDATLLASVAIILGTIFVVLEMKDNRRLVEATFKQADAAALQLKLNYDVSTVDLITKIYDFANSLEVQRSWRTVIDSDLKSYDEFEGLPAEEQLAFHQIASLFESVGLLVEKGYVKEDLVDDMFATRLAWRKLEPYVKGMRQRYATEDYYYWTEKLYNRLTKQA